MQELETCAADPGHRVASPELKELVVEASRALVRLDATRLEELALSCEALNRSLGPMSTEERRKMARQVREVKSDMAVFARVLEATRANWNVMNRLRELRAGQLEYTERQARGSAGVEAGYGDH
ncbi:MAG: hypothetical protein ABSC62_01810 [Terracidiphilus sp.]|jgi:hypothetical protein